MGIRARLIAARRAAGVTQEALEQTTGVSQSTISHTERGISTPTEEVARRLSAALGITMEDLLWQEPGDEQ